jgi:signal transduction histidine kinase
VDLTNIVADVFKTITFPNNVKLTLNINPLPAISLDPTFTRRALTNLINNAIQAMPNGGQLEVAAYQENSSINIVIADTGVGIPDKVKANIFTPMFTTKAKGQGLGLAVVKRLVEAQGGSISFESKVGVGTKFLIKLPIKRA